MAHLFRIVLDCVEEGLRQTLVRTPSPDAGVEHRRRPVYEKYAFKQTAKKISKTDDLAFKETNQNTQEVKMNAILIRTRAENNMKFRLCMHAWLSRRDIHM